MEFGNLSQLFNFDYKPDAGPEELSQPVLSKGNNVISGSMGVEGNTPSSNGTPDFQCIVPMTIPEEKASLEPVCVSPNPVITPQHEEKPSPQPELVLERIVRQVENDIAETEKALQKANEFKTRLRNFLRRVEATVDVTEKQLKKVLNSQLEKAKQLLREEQEKLSEREGLVRSVNEVYNKIQKLFLVKW